MYLQTMFHFREHPFLSAWPVLQKLLLSIINEKPKHIRIPGLIAHCYAPSDQAVFAASSSLALAYAAIVVMDDIIDNDQRFGSECAKLANMAGALFALSVQDLRHISPDPRRVLQAQKTFSKMYGDVALGQSKDAENPNTEDQYWQVARLKSGAFFKGAFFLGGLAGNAPASDLESLSELGEEYGLMLQVHDDLSDALEVPPNSDWLNGRFNLPILFAYTVDHPWKTRFREICRDVNHPALLEEAQRILVQCGALSYGLYQIQEHDDCVLSLLSKLEMTDQREIRKLFDELTTPVERLVNMASD